MLFFYLKFHDCADLHFFQVQLQEAERRWEEVQSYIRKRAAEHEAAQQGKGKRYACKLSIQYWVKFSPLYI